MVIEIVDFRIKKGDLPYSYVSLPEGMFQVFWGVMTLQNSTHPFAEEKQFWS